MFLATADLASRDEEVRRCLNLAFVPPLRDIVIGYAGDGSMRDFFLTTEIWSRNRYEYQGTMRRWVVWTWIEQDDGQIRMYVACSYVAHGYTSWVSGREVASAKEAWDITCDASAVHGCLARKIECMLEDDEDTRHRGTHQEAREVAPYISELMQVKCAHAMAMRELMRRAHDV